MGQRLLLVESDRTFLKEHQAGLQAAFDLDVASGVEGVIPRLESGAFGAVLISVEVADNKGYALCSTIRKNPKLDGVKIALISAKATEEEFRRHQGLKGRADLYLHKPITPSQLVADLASLVPPRAVDGDNPLGDLRDTELGEDWLDGLKTALEGPEASAPVFGVRPDVASQPEGSPDPERLRLLEEQVTVLEEALRVKDQRLLAAEAEAQQIQRDMNSVTLNLDELERSNREAQILKARLAETEAALHILEESRGREGDTAESLKAQLRESLAERTDLIQQVESLNLQVGEKAQRAIELLKERDRLQQETLDLEPFRVKAQELERALVEREAALVATQQEFERVQQAEEQLHTTVEGLVQQHMLLEETHRAAQLELQASGALVVERDQQLAARQETLQQHQDEIARLTAQATDLARNLEEATTQHEGERLELMNGLDLKEAEITRLNQVLAEQQQVCVALEREKQAIHGQLSEHRDRLQNLDGLLKDIQEQLRRGADLARG